MPSSSVSSLNPLSALERFCASAGGRGTALGFLLVVSSLLCVRDDGHRIGGLASRVCGRRRGRVGREGGVCGAGAGGAPAELDGLAARSPCSSASAASALAMIPSCIRKIWDAVEVSGKNVMQTSSVVTTSVVTHRYGDQAGEVTHDYLHATGNAFGVAWAVFKIRKALDPKGNLKKSSLVSQAAHAVAKESISRQKRK